MILSFLRKDAAMEAGEALYAAAVDQARAPAFYADYQAPDTIEGRFEMIALHVYLILRRLKANNPAAKRVGQKLFDVMFQDMDSALRELGVGDLSVGKKIRKLAENFFGRVAAYEEAISNEKEPRSLEKALGRNVYVDEDASQAKRLAAYVLKAASLIESQPLGRVAGGIVQFPNPKELV